MGRPKSPPEHREAQKLKRREYQRLWVKAKRDRLAEEREKGGQPRPKRGRPRDPRVDALTLLLALAQRSGHGVECIADGLTEAINLETDTGERITVKPNAFSQ